jgi:carotenoid cleavage dioxygenase-like enzyme
MNVKTGEVKQRQLSDLSTDFPRINEEYTGRKAQYVYCGVFDEMNRVIGVAKYDLDKEPSPAARELEVAGNIVGVFRHGPGRSGSEAIFVPAKPGMDGPEDAGYLIQFVYDESTGYVRTLNSNLCILQHRLIRDSDKFICICAGNQKLLSSMREPCHQSPLRLCACPDESLTASMLFSSAR